MEAILVPMKTICVFYTQYPHGGPSMPMPTPGGPAMYPGMSSQMPPAMPSGLFHKKILHAPSTLLNRAVSTLLVSQVNRFLVQ